MPESNTKKIANIPVNAILSIPRLASPGTILERIATVMGSRAMSIEQLRVALRASGQDATPLNSPVYLANMLLNGMTSVVGPDGQLLPDVHGRPVKAHLFIRVGPVFRVATPKDVRQEVLSAYEAPQ